MGWIFWVLHGMRQINKGDQMEVTLLECIALLLHLRVMQDCWKYTKQEAKSVIPVS